MTNRSTKWDALAAWMVVHWRRCLLSAGLLTVAALTQVNRIQFDDDFRNLFRTANRAAAVTDNHNDLTCLLMVYGAPLITSEGLGVVHDLHRQLDQLDGVTNVNSILDARQPRRVGKYFLPHFPGADADAERIERAAQTAAGHPMLDGQLLSAAQDSTLLFVQLAATLDSREQIQRAIEQVRSLVEERLATTPFEFQLTGVPVIRMTLYEVFTSDQWTFNVGATMVAILVSAIAFRSLRATLIILVGPVCGVIWAMATMAVVGEPLSIVNGMVGPLTLAIGLTAAVHMMYHYRRQCAGGAVAGEAAGSTIRIVAPACGWAALTTILGFLTLGIARLETIRHFGFICAAAVALTFLAVLATLPALCVWLQPSFSQAGAEPDAVEPSRLEHWLLSVTRHVIDRPRRYCLLGVVLIVATLAVATQLKPAIAISEALPSSGDTLATLRLVEQRFQGALPITLVVQWPATASVAKVIDALVAAHDAMDGERYLSRPLSLVSLLRSLPGETVAQQRGQLRYVPPEITAQFYDSAACQSYIYTRCEDVGTHTLEPVVRDIEDRLRGLEQHHVGFDLQLTGVVIEAVQIGNEMINDLARSLLCAVPLIALVLVLTFRSWRLGTVSIIPNVFPLAATAACIVLFGWNLRLFTVSLFAIFFGIAVDDTIHILLRFRRELTGGATVHDAILEAMQKVGPAVITTTLVLSAGVSVLLLSQIFGIRCFGLLFCCGLFWALVGDLLLLPACLAWVFGGRDEPTRVDA